ncbi:MAG: TetR/AcrR family transcriptional regulator [Proteobacteria bacterium]|nr:TetR/AcrR family transcriptional regulator [Pseudomonadota bacterium]
MSSAEPEDGRQRLRFPGVRAPKPVLAPETERRLTARQREVLDALEEQLAAEGLAELTMAEIAGQMNCSLRTLYGISPSKEELVLTVVDRRLRRIGRAAIEPLHASMAPLDALRAYLQAANEAVQPTTVAYSRALVDIPGAGRLLDAHEGYVIAVTQSLLDRAIAEGDISPVDTASLAHVLGGLGREFARPEVAEVAVAPAKATADAIVEIILRGLVRGR